MRLTIVLLCLIANVALSQNKIEEPLRYVVFYENQKLNTPYIIGKSGRINVYYDSVRAFDVTWELIAWERMDLNGDRINKGVLYLKYGDQRAILMIGHKWVIFSIFGVYDIPLIQLQHSTRFYDEDELYPFKDNVIAIKLKQYRQNSRHN